MKFSINDGQILNVYNLKVTSDTKVFLDNLLLEYQEYETCYKGYRTFNDLPNIKKEWLNDNEHILDSELVELEIEYLEDMYNIYYHSKYKLYLQRYPIIYQLLNQFSKPKKGVNPLEDLDKYQTILEEEKELSSVFKLTPTAKEKEMDSETLKNITANFFDTMSYRLIKSTEKTDSLIYRKLSNQGQENHKILSKDFYDDIKVPRR